MSSREPQPTRVAMTVGSTSRNGGEFEFKKISLSLERDLVPAENPIDAYRDIKALLERMVSEFQAGNPVTEIIPPQEPFRALTSDSAKRQSTADFKPAGNGNRGVPPKPAGSKLATLQERLGARLPDVQITDGMDALVVKPNRYLGEAWSQVNEIVRSLGGHWQKGQTPKDGSWRIPK